MAEDLCIVLQKERYFKKTDSQRQAVCVIQNMTRRIASVLIGTVSQC